MQGKHYWICNHCEIYENIENIQLYKPKYYLPKPPISLEYIEAFFVLVEVLTLKANRYQVALYNPFGQNLGEIIIDLPALKSFR